MERKSECEPVCPLVLCRRSSLQNKENLLHNILCLFRKALLLLKKKRYQEQLVNKTENQISNLERMVNETDLWEYCIWYVLHHILYLVFSLSAKIIHKYHIHKYLSFTGTRYRIFTNRDESHRRTESWQWLPEENAWGTWWEMFDILVHA